MTSTAVNVLRLLSLILVAHLVSCEKAKSRLSAMHPADVLRSSQPGGDPGREGPAPRPRPGRGHRTPLREELAVTLAAEGADTDKPSTRFLLDLYGRLEDGQDLQHATGHEGPDSSLARADTVRGTSAYALSESRSEVSLNFKLPKSSLGETTELAELRIPPLSHHPEEATASSTRRGKHHQRRHMGRRGRLQRIRVSVTDAVGDKQIQRIYRVSWRRDQEDGFSVLDITRVLQDMALSGLESFTNGTLQVSLKKSKRKAERRRFVRSIPALEPHSILAAEDAILVLYSRRPTVLLDDEFNITVPAAAELNAGSDVTPNHPRIRRSARKSRKMCALKEMTVDFSTLGWSDFIVYPTKFNAGACSGKCPSPVGHVYQPTNHAILQSMMRMHDRKTPRPCCVPVELKPLMMLYRRGNDVEIREHPNMVASKCGCL